METGSNDCHRTNVRDLDYCHPRVGGDLRQILLTEIMVLDPASSAG